MTLSEFDLIERFFSDCGTPRDDVILGVGDDAAVLRVAPGMDLVATLDTLVEGVHFLPGTDAQALGYKSLAVNLSDLAAMGAEPLWATLSLTLPEAAPDWVDGFRAGFCSLAREAGVRLVGGDTTRGHRAVSVEAKGLVPRGMALRRSGARVGDGIFVTGTLGDAGLALRALRDGLPVEDLAFLRARLDRPQARVAVGRSLRAVASAAIDISDGLLADLAHVLGASGVGGVVWLQRLPLSAPVRHYLEAGGDWAIPAAAGDDYELCFTVPAANQGALEKLLGGLPCPVTRIGEITDGAGLRVLEPDGREFRAPRAGYDHFVRDA
jgi:thiamine-monophosphate kinase